jgi:hypothetical protein
MKKLQPGKWLVYISVGLLVVFLSAEKSNLLKSDSLTAVACTKELFLAKPDEIGVITQHRDAILAEAQKYDLPPELLASIIYGHQRDLTPFRKFTDCAGSALGGDLSLGLAQIRVSNAATNDKQEFASMAPADFKNYRSTLLDPLQNLEYQAKELRQLLEREIRFPGITAEELVHDPFIMTLLMSEYRMGRQGVPVSTSRLSGNALFDLRPLRDASIYIFDRDAAESTQIQNYVGEYLDYVNCEREMFNTTECGDWHNWIAPLEDQDAIRGCAWYSTAPSIGEGYIFLAEWDEPEALMNIDGVDVSLQVIGDVATRPTRSGSLVKNYRAPGIDVQGTYTVTWDCSQSDSESCEVTKYRATYEVSKNGLSQTLQATGEVGC